MTNIEILRLFLKKHRKYASYKRQLQHDAVSRRGGITSAITRAFIASESKEGVVFWNQMSMKWIKLCKDFNIEGELDLTEI